MMTEKDKKFLGETDAIHSYYKNGGTSIYGIPKTGKTHDICIRGMGNATGQMQGYLMALREHGLITHDEWKEQMESYVYRK